MPPNAPPEPLLGPPLPQVTPRYATATCAPTSSTTPFPRTGSPRSRGRGDEPPPRPRTASGAVEHRRFEELPGLLRAGDLLVRNDVAVRPARLYGRDPRGPPRRDLPSRRRIRPRRWSALAKPGRRAKRGRFDRLRRGPFGANRRRPPRWRAIRAIRSPARRDLLGRRPTPLPPYIRRAAGRAGPARGPRRLPDRLRARASRRRGPHRRSPLHGGDPRRIRARGVDIADLTLAVGAGTFKPVTSEDIEAHAMAAEGLDPAGDARGDRGGADRGAAEWSPSARRSSGPSKPRRALRGPPPEGEPRFATDLFISPGFNFRVVDAILTNFHLPRSTLLMLVAAFAGRERVLAAYEEAVGGISLLLLRRRDADRLTCEAREPDARIRTPSGVPSLRRNDHARYLEARRVARRSCSPFRRLVPAYAGREPGRGPLRVEAAVYPREPVDLRRLGRHRGRAPVHHPRRGAERDPSPARLARATKGAGADASVNELGSRTLGRMALPSGGRRHRRRPAGSDDRHRRRHPAPLRPTADRGFLRRARTVDAAGRRDEGTSLRVRRQHGHRRQQRDEDEHPGRSRPEPGLGGSRPRREARRRQAQDQRRGVDRHVRRDRVEREARGEPCGLPRDPPASNREDERRGRAGWSRSTAACNRRHVYGSSALFHKLARKLLESYAQEALLSPHSAVPASAPSVDEARSFLQASATGAREKSEKVAESTTRTTIRKEQTVVFEYTSREREPDRRRSSTELRPGVAPKS